MDYYLAQFKLVVRRILDAIDKFYEVNASIAGQCKAAKEAAERQPTELFSKEKELAKEIVEVYKANQSDSQKLQKRTFWVGVITLAVVVAYTIVTFLLWTSSRQALESSSREFEKTIRELHLQSSSQTIAAFSARDSAEAARIAADISQRQVRAYVNIQTMEALVWDPSHKVLITKFTFTNSGQSPAKGVVTGYDQFLDTFHFKTADNCLKARRLRKAEDHSSSVLAPHGGNVIISPYVRDESNSEAQKIKSGSETMCVFGSVWYDDIFGMSHETEFCAFYLNGGLWANCGHHNEMYDYQKNNK